MPKKINQRLQDFLNQTFWVNSSHFGTLSVKIYDVSHDRSGRIDVLVKRSGTYWWEEGHTLFDTKEAALEAKKRYSAAQKREQSIREVKDDQRRKSQADA